MSTSIYEYNGTLLTTIADGTINTTAAPIQLPGKGYTNYGAPVLQDILWTMTNFAGTTAPTPLLQGVMWYDTNAGQLKIYNGSAWVATFKSDQNNIPATDLSYNLGSTDHRFANVYADNAISTGLLTTNDVDVTGQLTVNWLDGVGNPQPGPGILASTTNTYDIGTASTTFRVVYANTITATTVNATNITGDPTVMHTNATNVPTSNNLYNLGSAVATYANIYATTFHGTATSAQYADVAERYASDQVLEVGDVVAIGGAAEITKTTIDADVNVFGVISDKPALRMNDSVGDDESHPLVALLGRTPVKLQGPVSKGQRVVSSDTPGVARAAVGDEPTLAILGRALVNKQSADIELVEIVIGRC